MSFVVAGRHDEYGGDFLHRLQIFIDTLTALLVRYDLSSELLIIEWNPPRDRSRLIDALVWPRWLRLGMIRIIEVPSEIHKRLFGPHTSPCHEFVAKNVGIRRAKGEYVVATNPDCVYTDELIAFLALRTTLSPNCFYRVNRYDVDATVPILDCSEFMPDSYLRPHVMQVNLLGGSINLRRPPVGLGKLGFTSQLWAHRIQSCRRRNHRLEDRLFTNACGDFMLMPRTRWYALRGYPEQLPINAHVDSYLLVMATSSGLRQVVLPNRMRIYHQEHERPTPRIGYEEWLQEASEMLKMGKPRIFNDENWGLGNIALKEFEV